MKKDANRSYRPNEDFDYEKIWEDTVSDCGAVLKVRLDMIREVCEGKFDKFNEETIYELEHRIRDLEDENWKLRQKNESLRNMVVEQSTRILDKILDEDFVDDCPNCGYGDGDKHSCAKLRDR